MGNLNLLSEARRAGVKKFIYISVIHADSAPEIPMLDAKYEFEKQLKISGLAYTIYRPTGYFYDIAKVFKPMIDKGKVNLLKSEPVTANVIATEDFARHIIEHLDNYPNEIFEIGGKETYTYEEIARLFFDAAKKPVDIKYAPALLFDILAAIAHLTRNGKEANIRFGKWTLTHSMKAEHMVGDASFKDYIEGLYPPSV